MEELASPEQRKLAAMFFVFSLSGSFISVFLPAYYEILGSGNLGWAFEFLAVQFAVLAVAPTILLSFLHAKFEALLVASFPFYFVYYVLLLAKADPILTGSVAGVALSLFWPGFQTTAMRIAHRERVASTFTILSLLVSSIASAVGPVAGGLVISYGGGFATALVASGGLYFVALFLMRGFRFEATARREKPAELHGPPRLNYFLTVLFALGMSDVTWLAYPLFALSVAGSYLNLGVVVSAIGVMTALVGIWIARASDRVTGRYKVCMIGIVGTATALLALGQVSTVPELLAVSTLSGISSAATWPVLTGLFAANYDKEDSAPFWTRLELFLNPGRVVNLGLAALFVTSRNYASYFAVSGALCLLALIPLYLFNRRGGGESAEALPMPVRYVSPSPGGLKSKTRQD